MTYRELRELELAALLRIHKDQRVLDLDQLLQVSVDQMHGIEIEEWPARIAEVAMWLIDHQMNQKAGEAFGEPVVRLPLKKSAKIVIGNALRLDWNTVLPAEEASFVMGNPPFVGAMLMTELQRGDLASVTGDAKSIGVLDYVAGWYFQAAAYIKSSTIRCAFVSTSSITQGEQVGILWEPLFRDQRIKIHFGHRTFCWMSEARSRAHVHVVIIGFGAFDVPVKRIYEYSNGEPNASVAEVRNISPYLFEGTDTVLRNRRYPLCAVPPMAWGSQPRDGGHLIMSEAEYKDIIKENPTSINWIKGYTGADEFLNGVSRYCLWLVDCPPSVLRAMPSVRERVDRVRSMRRGSKAQTTRALADTPTLFAQIAHKEVDYLLVPLHTSESRQYIPIGFMSPSVVASNACAIISRASIYHYGVLSSEMHMAWVRQFCGRLESRYRYSKDIVYNNFPWPQVLSEKQRTAVEAAAQAVLDARDQFPDQTLADLYDPLAMPKPLRDAHKTLDRTVDKCYRSQPFTSDRQRVEYLFELYQRLTSPLIAEKRKRR